MARGTDCAAHRHDSLVPLENHHIWPLGYHGPDVKSNIIRVCANAHGDAHYLLEDLLKGRPVDKRTYGPVVRDIAQRGYAAVMAYAESLSSPEKAA